MVDSSKQLVLVTGATGYLAGFVIKDLLQSGYRVRGTVRKVADKQKYEHLIKLPGASSETLEFVEADLSKHEGWEEACKGCAFVMHVASPVLIDVPKNYMELIVNPAVEGTRNVLNAALKAGVKKVVVTSSLAAIEPGPKKAVPGVILDESYWADYETANPYEKSKYAAEKEAWRIYEENKDKIEVAVINPGFVVGPVMSKNVSASPTMIIRIMNNSMPGIPKLSVPFVDVRDVARAHVLALENPNATGKRFILAAKTIWMLEAAQILAKEFEPQGFKIPTKTLGKCPIYIASLWDPQARLLLNYIGYHIRVNNQRSIDVLGLKYTDVEESLKTMAYALIEVGTVKDKRKKN